MQKLFELLNQRNQKGTFGVEIECEGEGLSETPAGKGWKTEDDGSLRGEFPEQKAEFVFAKPLIYKDAVAALAWLHEYQTSNGAKFDFSFRTSVHVHLNMQQTTFAQYLNTVYTYLLLETVLVRYCGEERIGNRFCLRMQDGEGLVGIVEKLFTEGSQQLLRINNEGAKYAAINLAATINYGSLEFRAMKGNMDVPYISRWLRVLEQLREFACGFENPCAVHDFVVENGATGLLEAVLQKELSSFEYPDMVSDVMMSFSVILDLPHKYINREKEVMPDKPQVFIGELAPPVMQQRNPAQRKPVLQDVVQGVRNERVNIPRGGFAEIIRNDDDDAQAFLREALRRQNQERDARLARIAEQINVANRLVQPEE